jgi:ketosteroid isomerase-like protein
MGQAADTARGLYDALGAGDFDRVAEMIAPRIDWWGITRRHGLRRRTPS